MFAWHTSDTPSVVVVNLGSGAELRPEAPSLQPVLSGQISKPSLNYPCFLWLRAGSLGFCRFGGFDNECFLFGGTCQQLICKTFLASSLPSPFSLLIVRAGFPGSQCTAERRLRAH